LLGALRAPDPLSNIALKDGERPELRLAAAKWLVMLKAPKELLPALSDTEMDVRECGAAGMGELSLEINKYEDADPSVDLRLQVVGTLMGLLADTKRPVRHASAKSLNVLGDTDWQPCFPTPDGRISFDAMRDLDRPEVEELLIELLTVENAEDRRDAAKLMGARRDVNAASSLRVAAQDRDGSVRVQAVKALGELGSHANLNDEDTVRAIIEALPDRSAQVRHQAVVAAGAIGDVAAAPAVIEKLSDKVELVASAAAALLHRMQCDESLAALLRCVLSASTPITDGAVASLSRWNAAPKVLEALIGAGAIGKSASGKVRPEGRAAACTAVGYAYTYARGGDAADGAVQPDEAEMAAAHTALLPMLESRDEIVRVQAVFALGRIARPHALKPLVGVLKDRAVLVADAALGAIKALDWGAFVDSQSGEKVAFTAPTLKKMHGGIGPLNIKQLILTSAPRLLYVDSETHKAKQCELRLEPPSGCDELGKQMNVWMDGKPNRVQCINTNVDEWIKALAKARSPAGSGGVVAGNV